MHVHVYMCAYMCTCTCIHMCVCEKRYSEDTKGRGTAVSLRERVVDLLWGVFG